jgi:hypothetical protein
MNTAIAVNSSSPIPPAVSVSSMQDIPLNRIRESKTNPRRTFDEAKLAEPAGNIRHHGVLQPVLVRPLPDSEDGFFELVAIPATVRKLTDTECLELQLNRETATHRRPRTRRGAGLCGADATAAGHLHRRNARRGNRALREICVRSAAPDAPRRRSPASFLCGQANRRARL